MSAVIITAWKGTRYYGSGFRVPSSGFGFHIGFGFHVPNQNPNVEPGTWNPEPSVSQVSSSPQRIEHAVVRGLGGVLFIEE